MEDLNSNIILIKLLSDEAKIPVKASACAAGYDIFSSEDTILLPGEYKAISTGFSLELPEGTEAQIRPRSGLALKYGITVLNSPGTIDSDYRGEVKIILINHSKTSFEINKGDRIAQMVISKLVNCTITSSDTLSITERGAGGFGSTGKHVLPPS